MENKRYVLFAGLSGGFGGANPIKFYETDSEEDANKEAFRLAVEIFESHEGNLGLRTESDIIEDDGVDEEEAHDIYIEEREGWLEYYTELFDEDKHKDIEF